MAQLPNQIFSQVVVKASDVEDPELQEEIANRMFAHEQALMEESSAQLAVERATAALLRAKAARMESRAAVQESFAKADSRVAMEPNPWEPFRDPKGTPCIENFLSQRDQRNMMRAQKAQMNRHVEQGGDKFNDMFERGSESQ